MNLSKIGKFKVGFNYRRDTYTTKLGFINPLVKEATNNKPETYRLGKSYDNWKSTDITEEFYDNEPLSGFVLNYRVGGHSYSWGGREPKFRVLDPRGFEIEITLENMVDLTEYGMGKGKVFEGELIYVYNHKGLYLMNTEDARYKTLYVKDNSELTYNGEDFIVGGIYQTTELGSESGFNIYLGAFTDYKHVKGKNKNIGVFKKIHYFLRIICDDYTNIRNTEFNITSYNIIDNLSKTKIKYYHGTHNNTINKDQILYLMFKNNLDLSKVVYSKLYYRSNYPARFGLFGGSVSLPNSSNFKYVEIKTDNEIIYLDLSAVSKFIIYNNENYVNYYQIGDKKYIANDYYLGVHYKEHCERLGVIQEKLTESIILTKYFNSGKTLPSFKIGDIIEGISGLVYQGEIGEEIIPYSKQLNYVTFDGKSITNKLIKLNEANRNI